MAHQQFEISSLEDADPRLIHSSTTQTNKSLSRISFEEYLDLSALAFEWADSYDAKDWARLEAILAPTLRVDYTTIGKECWPSMTAAEYMAMVTDQNFLGDPRVKTQHLLGFAKWDKVSETEVVGHHQLRAAHQVYTSADLRTVKLKGHSHATNELYYRKVDGVWKFAGLKPRVLWNEGPFEAVFKGSYIEAAVAKL